MDKAAVRFFTGFGAIVIGAVSLMLAAKYPVMVLPSISLLVIGSLSIRSSIKILRQLPR